MVDLYLIAHRVRGESAFDIAIMLDLLDEDGDPIWIIPTSGHRAYPYWYTELDGLGRHSDYGFNPDQCPAMPDGHQDHYHIEQTVSSVKQPSLLARLNLHRTQPPIVRRI